MCLLLLLSAIFLINSLCADKVFYSEYLPHNGTLYINREIENHTTLHIKYVQLLSKYPEFTIYSIRNQIQQSQNKCSVIFIGNSTDNFSVVTNNNNNHRTGGG